MRMLADQVVQHLDRLLSDLPSAPKRMFIGYSGGADSTFLLNVLHRCGRQSTDNLIAVHVNHHLSDHADAWQAHCVNQGDCLGVEVLILHAELGFDTSNLEARARKERYRLIQEQMDDGDVVLFAHHADDQAETLFLNLVRGSGASGLAGMPEIRAFGSGVLIRPLLSIRRKDIESWLTSNGVAWVQDESNDDERFDRNFLRHQILPKLERRWPHAIGAIGVSAKYLNQHSEIVDVAVEQLLMNAEDEYGNLRLQALIPLQDAMLSEVLRHWVRRHTGLSLSRKRVVALNDMINAVDDAMPCLSIGSFEIYRFSGALWVQKDTQYHERKTMTASGIKPVDLNEAEQLCWVPDHSGISEEHLMAYQIKYRSGGERIQPAYQRHHRELKKLFQEWAVPYWLRPHVPLVYVNEQLIAVANHCVDERYRVENGKGYRPVVISRSPRI